MMKNLSPKVWGGRVTLAASLLLVSAIGASAQGILSVVPTRSVATTAGTGTIGNSGNGAAATSATLADPSAVAYDSAGNLYIADAQNHVIREVTKAGVISIFAGTGVEGSGGDGGPATAAFLDTPTGVAVDTAGNVYIADSHNHRIREVSAGTITTIAGTGTHGFSGDGAAATAATLYDPMGVAVDTTGNVYIADTNNQRIREVSKSTGFITTIAGDGEELFSGDGAAATAAVLDSPTAVAVDASGNVYIADRHNQRIREISGTTITTIAGSGAASFSGGFSGDGSAATASTLSKPSGVSVDSAGNIYIADTGNQRIRQLGGGSIATILGSGQQGFGGDTTAPNGINLNAPKAVASDSTGNLAIADKLNQRVRTASLPTLTYFNTGVGLQSVSQSITISNSGTAGITATPVITGPFAFASGGTCPTTFPVAIGAGNSCTQNILFSPVAVGAFTGNVTVSGTGLVPQVILLTGTGIQTATTVTLATNINPAFVTIPITFTATVKPAGTGIPTGTVTFFDGVTQLGTPQTVTAGVATLTLSTLAAGTHNITAVYSGDTNFTTSTSTALAQSVLDFNFTLTSNSPGGVSIQTINPGGTATFNFTVAPVGGPFTFPVVLSATGLPTGAVATFTPNPITIGATPANFTMTITVPALAQLHRKSPFGGGSVIALGLLLLPFSSRFRKRARRMPLTLCAFLLLSLAAIGGITGCGVPSGFFGQAPQTYTINVIGTATGTGQVVLQHQTTVTLVVQ